MVTSDWLLPSPFKVLEAGSPTWLQSCIPSFRLSANERSTNIVTVSAHRLINDIRDALRQWVESCSGNTVSCSWVPRRKYIDDNCTETQGESSIGGWSFAWGNVRNNFFSDIVKPSRSRKGEQWKPSLKSYGKSHWNDLWSWGRQYTDSCRASVLKAEYL